jgi:hypothetical protein
MIDKKNELTTFKNQIFKYGIIVALLFELISLPFLGWNPRFAYGLALGTCIAIVNFNLLAYSTKKILDRGRGAGLAVLGYMLRLVLYGGGFYISYRLGTTSGLATLLGYVTIKFGMYYVYGFKPKFSESSAKGKQLNNLDEDEWATQEKRPILKELIRAFKPIPEDDEDSSDEDSLEENNTEENLEKKKEIPYSGSDIKTNTDKVNNSKLKS